jgi:hypothetical protein
MKHRFIDAVMIVDISLGRVSGEHNTGEHDSAEVEGASEGDAALDWSLPRRLFFSGTPPFSGASYGIPDTPSNPDSLFHRLGLA